MALNFLYESCIVSTTPAKETHSEPNHCDVASSAKTSRDNSFREFRILCAKISEEPSYNAKTKIVSDFFSKGSDEGKVKMLLL